VADDVVDATLPHLPVVIADMVRVQRLLGCRPGEVCMMRPSDIDRSAEVWEYRPASHKTEHHGRHRVIFIGPKAQEILLQYLLRDADAYCFAPADSERKRKALMRALRKTLVQPSQRNRRKRRPKHKPGNCYVKDAYNRAICRADVTQVYAERDFERAKEMMRRVG
jgi:integrase